MSASPDCVSYLRSEQKDGQDAESPDRIKNKVHAKAEKPGDDDLLGDEDFVEVEIETL